MAASAPISLNNGVEMPALGLGVFESLPVKTVGAAECFCRASRLRPAGCGRPAG